VTSSRVTLLAVLALAGSLAFARGAGAFGFVPVVQGLENPVDVAGAPGDATTLYVVERAGRILIVRGGQPAGTLLDIRDQVWADGEGGLLSLAFSPQYAVNHLFYVDYTDLQRNTHVVEYRVGPDGAAVPSSARQILFVQQIGGFPNHKGGGLAFDARGRLYVGMGDGGTDPSNPGPNDPLNHGQDLSVDLGKLLRISPLQSTRPKIVAYGLRNPWRLSFDRATGSLWLGDVGAGTWEEIDFLPRARLEALTNFGWSRFEGPTLYHPDVRLRGKGTLAGPVFAYLHGTDSCAVVGGYVYRGSLVRALRGRYVYGDFCTGFVFSFKVGPRGRASIPQRFDTIPNLVSFGEVGGELYAVSMDGTVYRLSR
jgi:glucose/arabinose dehydrogenase